MLIKSPPSLRKEAVPVYLNVYDISPINGCTSVIGLGMYHSGVQGQVPSSLISIIAVDFFFLL